MTNISLKLILPSYAQKTQNYLKAQCLLNVDFECPFKNFTLKPLKISLYPYVQIFFI